MTDGLKDNKNPLLNFNYEIPFDSIKAEHVLPAIEELIKRAEALMAEVIDNKEARTFENTMAAFENITRHLSYAHGILGHLESVATYPAFREAYNKVQGPISQFYSSIPLSEGLWKAIKDFSLTDEASQLNQTRERFLKLTMDDFRRAGAELPLKEKERLAAINVELTQLTTQFSQNLLDATNEFELLIEDQEKLSGLPESSIDRAKEDAERKGLKGYRFTLQAPSFVPVMTYLDASEIREEMYRAYFKRGAEGDFDNRDIILRILNLRAEKAQMLGFENFADLVLEDRMAKTGETAKLFLEDLTSRVAELAKKENQELYEFRLKIEGPSAPPLNGWDVGYYAEKKRRAEYDFDEEVLRPYFQLQSVMSGLFKVAQRLFGVTINEVKDLPSWDENVQTFSLVDSDSRLLGCFYTDWFPRESKRGGAWMNCLITGEPENENFKPHLGLVCGNFSSPTGGKPALLTHSEVTTLFHEFGHLIHQLLSTVEVKSLSGTSVPWDFVELPSQILENWCWEKEALDMFARHYETGDPLPEELLAKLERVKNFRSANAFIRQLGFATLDLKLHTEYQHSVDGDVVDYSRRVLKDFSPAPLEDDNSMITGFSHLFSSPVGYAAGYYSYRWAEVLDADAFTQFKREGIFNSETGMKFRQTILSKGNSKDPMTLFKDFMGREPDPEALLEREGLLK